MNSSQTPKIQDLRTFYQRCFNMKQTRQVRFNKRICRVYFSAEYIASFVYQTYKAFFQIIRQQRITAHSFIFFFKRYYPFYHILCRIFRNTAFIGKRIKILPAYISLLPVQRKSGLLNVGRQNNIYRQQIIRRG